MYQWAAQRDEWLRSLYPDTDNRTIAKMLGCSYSAVKNRAQTLGLKKSKAHMDTRPGCFKPGQNSWNKGLSYQPGGRIAESQFKKGNKPQTWVPVGTESEDKDGYLKQKVSDDRTVPSRYNWKFVHVLKWEEYNGRPVPPKHVVRLKDGDRRNFSPENLVLVSMAENAILNKFFAMKNPPEGGFDVLLNLARIKLAVGKRKKEIAA